MHDAVQGHDVGADGQAHGRGAVAARVVDDDFTGVGHPRILAREHGHQPLLSPQEREHEDGLDGQIAVTAVNTVDDVVTDQVLQTLGGHLLDRREPGAGLLIVLSE